jgi:hypothetical protein
MYLNGSNRAVYRYTDYFNMAFLFNPEAERVLFIGGGGFSGPKQFLEYYPNATIDVVEIDPEVVTVAREHFGVTDDPRLRVFAMDGRTFLREAGTYDIVVLDAYSKTYVPFHLMTREFFEALDEHLSPDGVVVSNLISSLIGDTSELLKAEVATITGVLPQVYLFPTRSRQLSQVQNINLIATKAPARLDGPDLLAMAAAFPVPGVPFERYIGTLVNADILAGGELVLTDDYAPAEALLNAAAFPVPGVPFERYIGTLVNADILAGGELVLTDDYAPAEALLNPITVAPLGEGSGLVPSSTLNPLLIAGAWLISLASLYLVSTRLKSVIDV